MLTYNNKHNKVVKMIKTSMFAAILLRLLFISKINKEIKRFENKTSITDRCFAVYHKSIIRHDKCRYIDNFALFKQIVSQRPCLLNSSFIISKSYAPDLSKIMYISFQKLEIQ